MTRRINWRLTLLAAALFGFVGLGLAILLQLNLSAGFVAVWLFWAGYFATFEALALYLDRRYHTTDRNGNGVDDDGYTLSANTRKAFRIATKIGRAVFLAAFGGFVFWFLFHVVLGIA